MKNMVRTSRGSLLLCGAVAVLVAGLASPSVAATHVGATQNAGWTVSLLPLPKELPNANGYMTGTDGNGNYSGWLDGQVVTWSDGEPTLRGAPAGFEGAWSTDQNGAGVVVGYAQRPDSVFSRAFALRGNEFQLLPSPAGFTDTSASAINSRGDIVGSASEPTPGEPTESVAVLWKADDPAHPVVLDTGMTGPVPQDIDDDGTILLDSLGDGEQRLWRNGALLSLTVPRGFNGNYLSAVRNGRVVGNAYSGADARGVVWRSPDDPRILPRSVQAYGINSAGLILGRKPPNVPTTGPLAVWDGTRLVGELPTPPGQPYAQADVIGDDATIVGHVNESPLDSGPGKPVVWRYQSG